MSFGIDGLSSGLDTTSIITQLMTLERQPAVRMEGQISANNKAKTALNALSTKLAAVQSAAAALTDPTASFVPREASSTADHVTATASAGAPLGSVTFSVEQLASTHRVVTASTVADSGTVVAHADTTVRVSTGGVDHDIAIAAGSTLADVATAIRDAGIGIDTSVVDTGSGLKLQLSASTSGAASTFTADLSNLDAAAFAGGDTSTAVLTEGQDALLRVGTGPGAYDVTSTTNTFTGVLEGVTFTASAARPGEEVTVAVSEDPAALTAKVRTFVDAINAALAELDSQTDSGISSGTKGALAGDSTMRSLRDRLLNAVTYAVPGSTLQSGGLAGLQSTREGTLVLDEAKLTAALTDDPAAVEALFRSGDPDAPAIADRVQALADEATMSGTGLIATATSSYDSRNRTLEDSIAGIDRRIELKRATLQRQWAAVEVAMGAMQSQQSWLAGQISGLNANSAS